MSTIITTASRQWASRPMDQRFTSLIDLNNFCQGVKHNSRERIGCLEDFTFEAPSSHELQLLSSRGVANFTHWSFGQVAQIAGAPAGYLRSLDAALAADCLSYGLMKKSEGTEVNALTTYDQATGEVSLRAVTSPKYGRIWNADVSQALLDKFGDGVTGDWTVPGEFGKKLTEVTKENTTLYSSDRDLFVFLADETRRIELPNRRNGESGSLARGFFVWNSEVGSGILGVASFLFDYVCQNRIIWGAQQFQQLKVKHTSGAPERFLRDVKPAIEAYAKTSEAPLLESINRARASRFDDEEAVDNWLKNRKFNNTQREMIKQVHLMEENRPIESRWDLATAITAYARDQEHQDTRIEMEKTAGFLF